MLKVLFITNCPSPYRVKFFNELSKHCQLTVAFEMEIAKNRNVEWKTKEQNAFRAVFLKNHLKKEEGAFCYEVKRYIKEFRNDIIIVGGYSTPTGMFSIIYMRSHGIPFILNSDGGMIKSDSFIKRAVKMFFISAASYWLSTGENCTKYLVHYGADKERIYRYPFTSIREKEIGGVTKERQQILRERLGIIEQNMILFVGSFIYRKGLDILLEACRNFENTAVVLVGGDDISEFVSEKDTEYKCHIYIEGFKSEKEVKKYYQAADVFVLPTREDIWGLVVNEAMAAGLPVITTDQCGAGLEMVRNGENGYLIPADNADELTKRLKELLCNDKLMKYMGDQNLKLIKKYTIEEMARKHTEILKTL